MSFKTRRSEYLRKMGPIEDHRFYRCIRGLIHVQKLCGVPIQRHSRKANYYILKIYCTLCNLFTIGALVRTIFFFKDGISVKTDNLFAYLIIALYMASGATQIASFFSYQEVLPFWDSLISTVPQRFNQCLHKPKVVINCILAFGLCFLMAQTISAYYFILQPHPDPLYMRLAEPWTDTLTEARISFMVTFASFLQPVLAWSSCVAFFLTGSYYIRAGFIDLYKAMEDYQLLHLQRKTFTSLWTYRKAGLHLMGIYWSKPKYGNVWHVLRYLYIGGHQEFLGFIGIGCHTVLGTHHHFSHCSDEYFH